MGDQFTGLEDAARQARAAQSFIDQANALMASSADAVTFTCVNPPYGALFAMKLARAVWSPILQAQINDAAATVAAATGAASAVKAG